MKSTSNHAWLAGFAVALALLGGVTRLNWRHTARMQETAGLVTRTRDVQANLNRLLSLIEDIETGARGFVVTGDPAFLEPFESGLKAMTEQQRGLQQLIHDAEERTSLSALEPLIAERIALAQANVDLRRNSGLEAARQDVASGKGKAVMDKIRARLARMDAKEQALLEQRAAAARSEARNARLLTVAGIGLSFALLIAVFALVLRENRLRQQAQDQLDRFFTLSLDMLCIAGMDGYFKRLNPAFNQTLGYSTEETLARPFLDFVHPDDHAATLAEVEKLGGGEPTLQFENRYQCKDGSWKWLSWKCQPFPSEGLLYATARDITEQKAAEAAIQRLNAELQRRAAQLEEANKEMESFSYSVSHDLRSPLRGIDGFSQVLEEDYGDKLDDIGRGHLARVRAATRRMDELIDDLLKLSQITRARMHRQPVDLSALVRTISGELQRREPQRQVHWGIADGLSSEGDPQLIRVVLENLIGNAWKFTGKRSDARIEFGRLQRDDQMVFYVRDNGAGFDMAYAKKLFGAFQRLHSLAEFEGTGVGLATVLRIMHRHGGRVWAEGEVDKGAAFYFILSPTNQEQRRQ